MNVRTQADGEVTVYTFREGVLSAVGHDLCLRCESFRIEWDPERTRVAGTFDLRSLSISHAVERDGSVGEISDRDRQSIESHLHADVLRTKEFPTASFASEVVEQAEVRGALTLRGITRPLVVRFERTEGFYVAHATIVQSEFGITPFRAMLGALRVRDDVRIEVRVRT